MAARLVALYDVDGSKEEAWCERLTIRVVVVI
jgi:hypothetical protein